MSAETAGQVELGKVVGIHGLQGWLKLHSYCEPREQIFDYRPLLIGDRSVDRFEGKPHGKGLLIRIDDCPDRTSVEPFVGQSISVAREQLPVLPTGEYYWTDLVGLQVSNTAGESLGRVDYLIETGANDVLVVKGEQSTLIPYVLGQYVLDVDIAQQTMTVDWSADWLA